METNGKVNSNNINESPVSCENEDAIYCNPSLPNELEDEDIVKMKGDAIGDTLYSERFVLNTLIILTKDIIELKDQLEKDLCTLWDMTIERDVVLLLLRCNTLELIANAIQKTEQQRLIEILLGIIGNMACIKETRVALSGDKCIMRTFMELIDIPDSLTLIQLMRFLNSVLIFENSGDEFIWFQHFEDMPEFITKFAFILHNSTNLDLLLHALEALMAMCSKFVILEMGTNMEDLFIAMFVRADIVSGLLEAFKQIMPQIDNENDDTALPTQREQRLGNLFLEINCTLSQYGNKSREVYDPFLHDILNSIHVILLPYTNPLYLIPLNQNTQGVIENITEILAALNEPFKQEIILNLYCIWRLVDLEMIKLKKECEESWDKEAENSDSNCSQDENTCGDNICTTICDYFGKITQCIPQAQLETLLKTMNIEMATDLIKKLNSDNIENNFHDGIEKLKISAKNIWNINCSEIN